MAAATGTGRRALILDRDGVINEDTGYVHRIDDCRFIDGIFAMTAAFAGEGFAVVIATNQTGIGRGLYSETDFAALMGWMRGEFARHGVTIAAVYHSPDHPTEGVGAYRRESTWRKPGPGMILQAAADLSLDLARSWMVGDKPHDIEAGRAAGVGTLIRYDPQASKAVRHEDFWLVTRLDEVTAMLAAAESRRDATLGG
jgi:D-glycero-D-manno-heptose 1,7-bisphosphate phosphatase